MNVSAFQGDQCTISFGTADAVRSMLNSCRLPSSSGAYHRQCEQFTAHATRTRARAAPSDQARWQPRFHCCGLVGALSIVVAVARHVVAQARGNRGTALVETAAELYAELKRRGLHLRRQGNGRDAGLLRELCDAVGCPDDQLKDFLQRTPIPVATLLQAFMDAAAPFAQMYQEIWAYLDSVRARRASEILRLRVAPGEAPVELEQFREWAEAAETMLRTREFATWPARGLITVANSAWGLGLRSTRRWNSYRPGEPYQLLPLRTTQRDHYTQFLVRVHRVLQSALDDAAREADAVRRIRALPELDVDNSNVRMQLSFDRGILADLVPLWTPLFDAGSSAPANVQQAVINAFEQHVASQVTTGKALVPEQVRKQVECLALPFWRYRWRTYEIWVSVVTLRSLSDLAPVANVSDGVVPLDSSTAAQVASLRCSDFPSACVIAQMRTRFSRGRQRMAIHPDLSICFDDRCQPESRAVVIEAKQRETLTAAHVATVGGKYRDGSPRASGVLIVNYDDDVPATAPPPRVCVLGRVRPGSVGADQMQREVQRLTHEAGLRGRRPTAVLLDVSGSMKDHYQDKAIRGVLRRLLAMAHIKVACFNDRLLICGDILVAGPSPISTTGGTNLASSFAELLRQIGPLEALLVVSDGEYHDTPSLQQVPFRKRVLPSQLPPALDWLMKPTAPKRADDPAFGVKIAR